MLRTSTHVSLSQKKNQQCSKIRPKENGRCSIFISWTDYVLLPGRADVILLGLEGMLSDGVVVVGIRQCVEYDKANERDARMLLQLYFLIRPKSEVRNAPTLCCYQRELLCFYLDLKGGCQTEWWWGYATMCQIDCNREM